MILADANDQGVEFIIQIHVAWEAAFEQTA